MLLLYPRLEEKLIKCIAISCDILTGGKNFNRNREGHLCLLII